MNNFDFLNDIADWILLTALPGIGLFIVYYAKKSPWRKMFVGRTMMYLAIALGMLFLVNTASIFLGVDYAFRPLVRVLAYSILSLTVWRLFFTLRHVQKTPFEKLAPVIDPSAVVCRDANIDIKTEPDADQDK